MKKPFLVGLVLALASFGFASDLIFTDRVLTFDDPIYDRTDEGGALDPNGMGVNYHTLDFYVTQSGSYDLEMAIKTGNPGADLYLFIYQPVLDPLDATMDFLAGNDDSGASLTVLSGSYLSGSSGRSALYGVSLNANTQYQAVMTTFWFLDTLFGDVTYDLGLGNGPGDVLEGAAPPVPEPASFTILGFAALAVLRKRRK